MYNNKIYNVLQFLLISMDMSKNKFNKYKILDDDHKKIKKKNN